MLRREWETTTQPPKLQQWPEVLMPRYDKVDEDIYYKADIDA